jgi:ADP-ribose pyrophosphatase
MAREARRIDGLDEVSEADFSETTLSSRSAYRGRFLELRADEVRLPDGGTAQREYIVHPGAAIVLARFDDGDILMERQYRYPLRQHFYELPAGKLEPGEPSLRTAQRELQEETGYRANQWKLLARTHPCIGYSNEIIDFYLADELEFIGGALDQGEFLETFRLPLATALAWIDVGRVTDTKTVLGLLWAGQLRSS